MPARVAGGDHHLPPTPRQIRGQRHGILSVIKDQQPPVPLPQYPQQPRYRRRGGVGEARHTQSVRQLRQPSRHQRGLLGRDPPHHVILRPVPVGVLNGQRGLPDPTHPVQCPHHRRRTLSLQRGMERGEQRLPPGEHRIPGRHIPHPPHQRITRPGPWQIPQPREQRLAELLRRPDPRRGHPTLGQPGSERLLPSAIAQIDKQIPRSLGFLTEQQHQPR